MKLFRKYMLTLMALLLCITNFTIKVAAEDEEIIPEEEPSYTAAYIFVSDDESKLPDEVLALLPETKTDLKKGDVIKNEPLDNVETDDTVYSFQGWSIEEYTIEDSDVEFIGTWAKKAKEVEATEPVELEDEKEDGNKDEEKLITISYRFVEQSVKDGVGNLPDSVKKLLPEDSYEKADAEHNPPELSETSIDGYNFTGWERVDIKNSDIVFYGVWENTNPKKEEETVIRLRKVAGSVHFSFGGHWDVPNGIGYVGTHAFLLDGTQAYCIEPYNPMNWEEAEAGTLNYNPDGTMSGKVADIIVMGETNEVPNGHIQAAVFNALNNTSYGGADCQPDYWAYDADGWDTWINTFAAADGSQSLATYGGKTPKAGYLRIYKTSTKANMTNSNALYSLAGAEYGVYRSLSDAQNDTSRVTTLTTGSNGYSSSWETRNAGTYYVKELKAGTGFKLDTNIYTANVSLGSTATVTSKEEPLLDPSGVSLYKYNERTGRVYGYDKYLDEAEFTVRYYDTYSNTDVLNGRSPKFTWVFKAEFVTIDGVQEAQVLFNTDHLVSATDRDTFNEEGSLLFPLGTITIEETRAPEGFAKDPNIYFGHSTEVDGHALFELETGTDWLDVDNLDMTQREEMQTITINIQKKDKETGLAEAQGLEDLSGAKFEIRYYDPETEQKYLVGTVTTDAQGKASLSKDIVGDFDGEDLTCGTYYIKEIESPDGYQLYPGEVVLEVAPDRYVVEPEEVEFDATPESINTAHFDLSYEHTNIYIRGGFTLTKHDIDFMENRPQGDATNLTTTYEVISLNDKDKVVDFNLDGVEDKENEVFSYNETCFRFTTDSEGKYSSIDRLLPEGKYRIVEVESPTGYLVEGNTKSRDFEITYDGQIIDLDDEEYNDLLTEQPIRGGVKIAKRDFESEQNSALGGASVGNAYVQIINRSINPVAIHTDEGIIEVQVGGVIPTSEGKKKVVVDKYTGEEQEYTGITNEDGILELSDDYLPYGTYDYVEIVPPTGYLKLNDPSVENLVGSFRIREDKVIIEKITLEDEALFNHVTRGDFEIRKIDAESQDLMAGIEFSIESVTTGEKHYFTTDENGYYSSASSWNLHSYDTNGGTAESGMWFGDYIMDGEDEYNQSVPVNDSLGALPYDTYLIKEIRGENNIGKQMYKGYVIIRRNNVLVSINNVENVNIELKTTATSGVENSLMPKFVPSTKDTKIIDTVEYRNLRTSPATEYTLVTILMDKNTGMQVKDMDGNPVQAEKTFEPASASGTIKTEMILNMENLEEGIDAVVFEFLYEDGELAAQHADLDDEAQTVAIPGLKTTATDNNTEAHVGQLGEITVTDIVRYSKLQVNRVYTITGKLMDKDTGEAVLDEQGNELTDEVTFRARQSEGEVELTFSFKVEEHGHSYVAFEELIYEEDVYAVHADLDDEDQSVHYPAISTQARSNGVQNVLAKEDAVIIDTIYYTNLSPLHEYTVNGKLMDKATGEAVKDEEGNVITGTATFTPEADEGSVDVEFRLDASKLSGHKLVCYERLYYEDFELVVHEDLEDEEETLWIPEIKTLAHAEEKDEEGNFYKNILLDTEAVLIDTVEYRMLQPDHEYVLKARLYDKETQEILKDEEGNDIVVTRSFTAEEENGTVDVEFKFDTTQLAHHNLTAYEVMFEGQAEIAKHEDADDSDQTVEIVPPEIKTTALNKDEEKTAPFGSITLIDRVEYRSVKSGREYILKGSLMYKDGEPVYDKDGEEVTGEITFTPETRNGEVDMPFSFNYLDFENTEMVVFEDLYIGNILVAEHEDLEDEDQSIELVLPKLSTLATDENGERLAVKDHQVNIIDTISYEDLNVDNEYTIIGRLYNKETEEILKNEDGEEYIVEKTFKPLTRDGEITLEFEIDGSDLDYENHLVVFEKLYLWDIEITDHEDAQDEDQTIEFYKPEIATTAYDNNGKLTAAKDKAVKDTQIQNKDKIAILDSEMIFRDSVEYKYLDTQETYVIKGILMNKTKEGPLLVNGETVESKVEFMPPVHSGMIDVEFTFDGSYLAPEDADVIVFETLYLKKVTEAEEEGQEPDIELIELADHEDTEDEAQWIHIYYEKPVLKTTASFANGKKDQASGGKATIVDTIEYSGLDTNLEYTVKGVLVSKNDQKTIETGEITFKPETRDGKVTMSFTVDSSGWGNKETVVFEELYRTRDGRLEATHKDIGDRGQTVSFYDPTRRLYRIVNTGAGKAVVIAVPMLALACIALLIVLFRKEEDEQY
ncbi:MAG: VaFE repeat-containing surface-anchored protein [Erysipelotrichaceae bacterium]|nr:VaFE repeat-containing surface-anchored protein [Erysipelotrichaceae bacterium]